VQISDEKRAPYQRYEKEPHGAHCHDEPVRDQLEKCQEKQWDPHCQEQVEGCRDLGLG
jgi:hypothetical protein